MLDCGEFRDIDIFDEAEEEYLNVMDVYNIPVDLVHGDIVKDLIHLNDTDGYTFSQIADWIETNVEFI